MIANSVRELIEELSKLPPDMIPMGIEPPFDGVKLVVQNNKVLLCRPREPEYKSFPCGN